MASGAIIGALRVVLGADTAALDKGLKNSQSRLEKFGHSMRGVGAAVAASFAAIGGIAVLAIKGAINEADKLGKMAQSIGIPVEELSRLKHAADLSGVSLEGLSKGVARLNRNIVEGAQGLQTPIRAFDALGIAIRNTDGSLKTVSQILPELAGKFATMRDGPEKTAFAMQLLGRAGADMIPLLNGGAEGLRKMMREADELGLVIDSKTAKAAEDFNDNLTRLARVKDGLILKITAELLPALSRFSQVMIDSAKNTDIAKTAADFIVAAFTRIAFEAASAVVFVQRFKAELLALHNLFAAPFGEQFSKAWEAFNNTGEETRRTFENLRKSFEEFRSEAATFDERFNALNGKGVGKNVSAPIIQAAAAAKNALESFLSSTAKRKAALEAEFQTIGVGTAAHERLRIVLGAETVAKENNIVITEAMRAKIEQTATSYAMLAQKVEEARERFNVVKSTMEGIASKFEDALVALADGSKKAGEAFSDMAKGIVSDLLRMIIRMQITIPLAKSLMSIFGGGGGGGGFGSLFAGFGKLFGFAQGGSFAVAGAGGIDSQMVAFRATPNERVTVTKPGQGMGGNVYAPVYNIDARGADAGAVARIERGLMERDRTFNDRVASVNRTMRVRGGRP
ncbi:MAG: hypothetical protein GEU91_18465 [Rhizobiales bacterium]|nr:hypothetical protein [Hyphomicrobiales bacterium]